MPQNEPLKYLALGDSYTIGESVAEQQRWPVQLVAALALKGIPYFQPTIIAATGWRTDDLRNAVELEKPLKNFDLVSLLIGVNNQYQGKSPTKYAVEFEELLEMAIELAHQENSKVIVLSIPDYGFTPFGKIGKDKISMDIDHFNAINKSISEKMGVKYVDITDISRMGLIDTELVADDGLHPSGKMYRLWVSRIVKELF